MGLGLLLVTSLVESYGGRVPGDHKKGARLVVVLRAVEAGRRSNGDAHRRESE